MEEKQKAFVIEGNLINDLPNKPLLRVDECATYFDVSTATIYLWIDHGILEAEKIKGTIRIPREAVLNCRLKSKMDPLK